MRRTGKASLIGLVATALGFVLVASGLDWELEERYGLWLLFSARGPIDSPPDVVIVDVGTPSEVPRTVHARLISRLTELNASVVAVDIFYPEDRADEDVALAAAIDEADRVVLAQLAQVRNDTRMLEIRDPVSGLATAALGLAPAPLTDTPTGMSRFWTFLRASEEDVGRATLPSVALQIHGLPRLGELADRLPSEFAELKRLLRRRPGAPAELRHLMDALRLDLANRRDLFEALADHWPADRGSGGATVEANPLLALLDLYTGADEYALNVYGPPRGVCKIPYEVLLAGDDIFCHGTRIDLAGKAVFVGDDAQSDPLQRQDRYHTVYSGVRVSGVELAATAFANLLTGRRLRLVNRTGYYGIVVAFGFLLGVVAYLPSARFAIAALLVVAVAYFVSATLLYSRRDLLIPVGVPIAVQFPVALFAGLGSRYLTLRRYVPYEAVEPGVVETVNGVCLTTDVSGSTQVADSASRDEVSRLMADYFEILTRVARRHGGLVTGLAGDRMVCLWKRGDVSARERACRAALEIEEAVRRFNEQPGRLRLPTRIGLHAGVFDLRSIGGGDRYEYQPVGDVPNTAARIEDLNKQLGTTILASEAVVGGLRTLAVRRMGGFRLRGKLEPTVVFELSSRGEAEDDAPRTD